MGSHFRVRLEVRLLGDQMNKICFGPVSEYRLQRERCSTPALWRSTLPVAETQARFPVARFRDEIVREHFTPLLTPV